MADEREPFRGPIRARQQNERHIARLVEVIELQPQQRVTADMNGREIPARALLGFLAGRGLLMACQEVIEVDQPQDFPEFFLGGLAALRRNALIRALE